MTTAIMMVTYNRLELTKRMLKNFFTNTIGPYHLIIVDNGSTDGTQDWLKEMVEGNSAMITLHFNSENKGIAVGRNQGLQLADKLEPNAEYLCTIDNDIDLHYDWLRQILELIKDNERLAIGINFEGTDYPLVTRNGKAFQKKPDGNLGTACSVFHRNLHKKIGFFTLDYGLYGEEDADWYFRARMAGWEIGYLPGRGSHFGEGELDVGEYREFKTKQHRDNLAKFQKNCYDYMSRIKPCFIPFNDPSL